MVNIVAAAPPREGPKAVDRQSPLYKACEDFEAIFLKQLLGAMRKTVPKDGLLDGGTGREIYEDMLYDAYAQKISQSTQLGLARMMYEQISKTDL